MNKKKRTKSNITKTLIPCNEELLKKKIYFPPKIPPIWVTLLKEMSDNVDKKPYNEKVAKWLMFLKDLIRHYYNTVNDNYQNLKKEVGPVWYVELSEYQRTVLIKLKESLYQDCLSMLPQLTIKSLKDLGLTITFPEETVKAAFTISIDEPGVFLWHLYSLYYGDPPSKLRKYYDSNAKLMMSAIVFVDLDECLMELKNLTERESRPPRPIFNKGPKKYEVPHKRYGEYLQKMKIPCYCNHPDENKKVKKKPEMPLIHKVKLRSRGLQTRIERNTQNKPVERICHYKFWQAPFRSNEDAKKVALIKKLKMSKLKAKPLHMKGAPRYDNIQCIITGVSYSSGKPIYIMETIANVPTNCIPINGGDICIENGNITNILGFAIYPRKIEKKCDSTCNCLAHWDTKSCKKYLDKSKCVCGHQYDLDYDGKSPEKYFSPPKRNAPFRIDYAKVYQFDGTEEFIKKETEIALESKLQTPKRSSVTISPKDLKPKHLLKAYLGQLSYTSPLLIPHLPQADRLKILLAFIVKRVKGKLSEKENQRLLADTERKWINLDHIDFRARAAKIPFTKEQLKHLNFSHRVQLQKLSLALLRDFEKRNRLSMMEHTNLFWKTMKSEIYPDQSFLKAFFTYMPSREIDTYVINPYSIEKTPKYGAKTCPLRYSRS